MKVLYVGHYRERSGWGEAATNYILALNKVGIKVACRPIIFNNNAEVPQTILDLEKVSYSKYDVCIQNVLPHFMMKNTKCKQVGQFVTETTGLKYCSWTPRLSLMDALFVPTTYMLMEWENNIKDKPIHIIHHCFDISKYKEYKPLDINLAGKYVFYSIGEFNRRKNISSLLRAFHSEFSQNDNVALILKVNKQGLSSQQLGAEIDNLSSKIKTQLRLYNDINKYHKEYVIPFETNSEDICRLHHTANCFVTTSFGEAWSIPAFEAMAYGNDVISSFNGGTTEFLPNQHRCGISLANHENVFGADFTFPGFGSAKESWCKPCQTSLQYYMRYMYDTRSKFNREQMRLDRQLYLQNFSHETVGNKMKKALEKILS